MQKIFPISPMLYFKQVINTTGEGIQADSNKFFSEEKALQRLAILDKLGLKSFNTWVNNEVYAENPDDEVTATFIAQWLAKRPDIQPSSFHFHGSMLEEDIEQRQVKKHVDRTLALYAKWKPRCFVLHPGTYAPGGFSQNKRVYHAMAERYGEEKVFDLVVSNIRYFGQRAAEYGIKIAVENLFGGRFYSKIDDLIRVVEAVDLDNVGYCFDSGHANVDGLDIPATIRRLSYKLFELHLHDNNGQKDQHLPIGFGIIDWVEVINVLNEIDYQHTITFEFPGWPLADFEQRIEQSILFWRTMETVAYGGYNLFELK